MGGEIRDWKPLQKAKYIVDLMSRRTMSASEAAELTGLSPQMVNKFIRSYFGFIQATDDEEWGGLEPSDFAIFNEAVFARKNSPLWSWLEWNDSARKFENVDNLSELLRLMKDQDDEGNPRIARVNPQLRDYFQKLLTADNGTVLDAFLAGDIDLERAYAQATREEAEEETRAEATDLDSHLRQLKIGREHVLTLPVVLINQDNRADDFLTELKETRDAVAAALDELES